MPKIAILVFFLAGIAGTQVIPSEQIPFVQDEDIIYAQSLILCSISKNTNSERGEFGLLRTSPNPMSGSSTIRGAYIKAGELVNPNKGKLVSRIFGSYDVITVVTGEPKRNSGSYDWDETAVRKGKGEDTLIDPYSPFHNRVRYVLCCFDEKAVGKEKFQEPCWIPNEWIIYVDSTLKFIRDNAALFDEEKLDSNKLRLDQLITASNPLSAIEAARIRMHTLPVEKRIELIKDARGIRQGCFTYFALQSTEFFTETIKSFDSMIKNANEESLILGMYSGAALFARISKDPEKSKAVRDALALIDEKTLPPIRAEDRNFAKCRFLAGYAGAALKSNSQPEDEEK